MKTEREVGRGKDGESFDEDVGDGFISRQMWVELVPDDDDDETDVALLVRRKQEARTETVEDEICGVR